jgi:hypothetical protein
MKSKISSSIALFTTSAFLMVPFVAMAAPSFTNISELVTGIGTIVSLLIPIAFALILLFFFWGLAKYMLGDAEDKEKGKNLMIWGVIALFVAASIWGLVAFLRDVFGVGDEDFVRNPAVEEREGLTL